MSRTQVSRLSRYAPIVLLLALIVLPMKADLSTRRCPARTARTEVERVNAPLKQQALDASMNEALRHARYDIKWAERSSLPDRQSAYGASNPAQSFYSHFTPDGLHLADSSRPDKAWQMRLTLESVGYGARQKRVSDGRLTASNNRIEYSRDLTGARSAITEWYVNREDALEQGFTLRARPDVRVDGERLRLEMKLEGDLRAKANASGHSVELLRASGERVLSYEHLVVKDADGKPLEASMGASAETMWLEVDDSNAVYPVTIDPAFVQQTFIKASNTDPGDAFGATVAISGDTLVVGAPAEASNATGINGDQSDNSHSNAGAVYVFVRTNGIWAQQAYLKPPDTSHAQFFFGQAVAISGDTIVVGRPGIFAGSAGVAYVFVRNGVTWSQQASLIPSDVGPSDNFGYSVAVEGDTVVVGAPFPEGVAPNPDPRPGFAFVFVRSGVTWAEQAKLMASNANTYDGFGWSVGVSGNTIVVGANNEDSNSTGINNDGGNNLALNAGAAYAFVRSGVTWTQQAYIKASNTDAVDHFGNAVGIAGDTIVVGAPVESSNATGINGDQNNNLANASGAVYVFTRSGVTWSQQAYVKASNTDAGDGFGSSIAIQGDTMIVGAPAESSNATGVDGNQNNNSASNAGAAYFFVRSGVTWSQQSYLKASNTALNAQFGYSVGLSGGTLIVGARQESSDAVGINGDGNDNLANSSGAAYVFVPFSFTNNQPSIFSVDVTPQQGSPFVHSQIASVGDIEDAASSLTVTINGGSSATVNGVTVTLNPTSPNATGQVFADVVANCTATPANFTLRVTDTGGLINEAVLTVLIKPDDLPLLGTYVVTSVAAGSSFNVTPSAVPSDNGSISSLVVTVAPPSFTGTATVNQSTGVVSITNANPPGVYNVTVTVTDNCSSTFSKDFRLTVNSATGCTILVNSSAQEVTNANPNGITNGNCTLGEAILTANTGVQVDGCSCSGSGSPYRIVLSNATYTLSARHNADYGFNGLPSIKSEITIQGNGAIIERSTAPGTPTFRLFNVSRDGDLTLQNVMLRGGLAKGGNGGDSDTDGGGGGAGLGGAIYNHGRLRVTTSTLTNNIAQGGNGGNVINSAAFGSGAGGGGLGGNGGISALVRHGSGGGGGSGGNGGSGFDATGCQLGCPSGGGGGGGDQIGGDGGDGGQNLNMGGAGGLNFGGRGGDGAQGAQVDGQPGSGIGGGGGGAYLGNGGDGNIGGGGGGGLFGFSPRGLAGNGGLGGGGGGGNGLYVLGGNGGFGGGSGGFSIAGFEGFGGGNGGFLSAGGGGGGGLGGAIFSDAGVLVITNATISGNFAKGGAAGAGAQVPAFPPAPGQGLGAGVFARNAFVTINYVTLSNNSVTDGTGATVALGGGALYLLGDGKMATRGDPTSVSFSITNTILANTPGNASDAFLNMINSGTTSAGTNTANLVEFNGSTSGGDANDVPGVTQSGDPNLGPLTLNAPGNTPTHSLNSGSPAIDRAIPTGGVTVDQRGLARPVDDPNVTNAGDGSDIGAYEAVPSGTCILTCSSNIARSNDPNQCGAVVTYQPPSVVGSCGTVTCSPASGSSFPVGTTTVTCSIAGGPSCAFTVTIQDTQPPAVSCPANMNASTSQACAVVNYTNPTAMDNCTGATVNCSPASGTCFPLGVTTVTCTATDASNNTAQCSFTVAVTNQSACATPPAGMVSWWPGDGDANDIVGANNGTLEHGATFTASGKVGQAFSLDGVDDDVLSPSINVGDSFTVDLWIFPTSAGAFQHLVSNSFSNATNYGALYLNGDHIEYWQHGTSQASTAAASVPLNAWTHVALTYEGRFIDGEHVDRIYINGSLAATSAMHVETFNNAVKLGFATVSSDFYFKGRMDEVEIHNRALSQAAIQTIVTADAAGKCKNGPFINLPATFPNGYVGAPYSLQLMAVRGTPSYTFTLASGALPPGLDLASDGTLSGTPTTAGTFNFSAQVTDSVGLSSQRAISITILACSAAPSGMVSWWPGNGNANDIIGTNNGTLVGGAHFNSGKVDRAFSVDGVDDEVVYSSMNVGNMFTVDLWIFPTAPGVNQHLVSNNQSSATNYGAVYFNGDHIEYFQGGTLKASSAAASVPLNAWTHVALTYDGSVDRLYINGSLTATSGAHAETFNNAVKLGYAVVSSDFHFAGGLDEVHIFNRALSVTDVQTIFNAAAGGLCGSCTITCPSNIVRSNDPGQCGATVSYQSTTTGNCGAVTCAPASGSTFSVGTTTVTCSEAAGPSCSFTVTVNDTQAPAVACPAHIDATAPTGQNCTAVNYTTPTANDNCSATVNCLPASGTCFPLGTTTVTCTATDASQNTSACSFTITVTQQVCAISCPANITKNNDPNQCGAVATYATPVPPQGCGAVTCAPASGSFFPKGTTTVTCGISGGPGCSFTITVNDTQPPSIACPANKNASTTTGQTCATVNYTTPSASDNCGGSPMVSCSPASGTCFPIGTTTVTCTAMDSSKNTGSCSFTVTVAPPCTITCPGNITRNNDPNQCGAVVTFAPTTSGGGCGTTSCSPASGSFFPKGTTTVTCSTTAGPGCSFTVTVNDTQPPTITCPAGINIAAEASCPPAINKVVGFAATASDNCPGVNVVCSPPSGSTFPMGTTNVTCTAIDSSGNTAECSFAVSVFSACLVDQSNPGNVVLFNTLTGDYRFCCGGVLLAAGKGVLTMRGCIGTIDDQKGARKVHIGFDFSANSGHGAGTAALFLNGSTNPKCSITDQSMAGNACVCASAPPPAGEK